MDPRPSRATTGDRYKPAALAAVASFALLMVLPANFAFPVFAVLLLLNGVGMGLFAAPNTTGIMNRVAARRRGGASGMRATFQNTEMA